MKKLVLLLIAVLALTLSACGSKTRTDNDATSDATSATGDAQASEPEAPVAEPATGAAQSGDGYTYNAPEGWAKPPQSVPGFTPDTIVANLSDKDGFADNVNTVVDTTVPAEISLDDLEAGAAKSLKSVGATNVSVEDRTDVAGKQAIHITSELAVGGPHDVDSYFVTNGKKWVAVTFSSNDLDAAERQELADSVLASWSWN